MQTTTLVEVSFRDCDMFGIVHNSVYPLWYEIARLDFLEGIGISYADLKRHEISPVVADLHIQYKSSATYPQRLVIRTKMGMFGARKIQFIHEMFDESGMLINTAETFHVWVKYGEGTCNIEKSLPELYEKIKKAGRQ